MSTPENVVRVFFDQVINQGRLDLIDEMVAEDFTNGRVALETAARLAASPTTAPLRAEGSSGRDGFRRGLQMMRSAFPDYRNDIDELVVQGDHVAGRWTATGTHLGVFLGIQPTGRRLDMAECGILTIEHGRLRSFWGIGEELKVLAALGAVTFHP